MFIAILAMPRIASAQVSVDVGATAYVDYYYSLSSPVEEEEGMHGFTYRRLYLTTDFRFAENFKGRARLEANDGTIGSKGPVPFVKDLYLTWNYTGDHSVTMGVAPPPAFVVSEDLWDYRSLEKTILDLQGIVDSRDFGVRFNGPILSGGKVRYAAMVANNEAARPEVDKYKRGYVQLEVYPTNNLTFTVGADRAGFGDETSLQNQTRISALAGFSNERFAIGVEPYVTLQEFEVGEDFEATGISVFGRVNITETVELVARADRVREERNSVRNETFFLGGLAFKPNGNVRIIPNIWYFESDQVDTAETLARLTLDIDF